MAEFLTTVFWFLVVLTPIVFVHELGHYWVARINGVRVEAFSVGFGRELFGFTDKLGTRWKFALIPIGGYVKMFGQSDTPTVCWGRVSSRTARPSLFAHAAIPCHLRFGRDNYAPSNLSRPATLE